MFGKVKNIRVLLVLSVVVALTASGCKRETAELPKEVKNDLSDSYDDLFGQSSTADEVVLRVNGREITQGDIDYQMMPYLLQLNQNKDRVPPEQLDAVYRQARETVYKNLVQTELLKDAAIKQGVEIAEELVDAELEKQRASVPAGKTLEELLAEQGVTLDEARERLALRMAAQKLYESASEGISATEEEARAFFDERIAPGTVTASHILLLTQELTSEEEKAEKKEEIEKIRKDIVDGKITFEEAVKTYGEDPGLEQSGWQYAGVKKGDMVPEFDAAIFSQKIGEVGEVVETSYGYHLIKVSERQPNEETFEELQEEIIEMLTAQKKRLASDEYMKNLLEAAVIEDF